MSHRPQDDFADTELAATLPPPGAPGTPGAFSASGTPPVMSILFPARPGESPDVTERKRRNAARLERLRETARAMESVQRANEIRNAAAVAREAGVQIGRAMQRAASRHEGWYWFTTGICAGGFGLFALLQLGRIVAGAA
jgi:hypothetical protein